MKNKSNSSIARKVDNTQVLLHDIFNIISLIVIIIVNSSYLYEALSSNDKIDDNTKYYIPSNADNDSLRFTLIILGIYLIVDSLWILIIPQSILSSPKLIVAHHIATLIYIYFPWYYGNLYGILCSSDCMVEINTLIIVLRRRALENTFIRKILDGLFLITWLCFRIIIFPIVAYFMIQQYLNLSSETYLGTYNNIHIVACLIQSILTLLGFYWTWEIYIKFFKQKKK